MNFRKLLSWFALKPPRPFPSVVREVVDGLRSGAVVLEQEKAAPARGPVNAGQPNNGPDGSQALSAPRVPPATG